MMSQGWQLVKIYLLGLVPFTLIFLENNFSVPQARVVVQLSWSNAYFLVSYLVFFPWLMRHHRNRIRQSLADRFTQKVDQPWRRTEKQSTNWELEALRIGFGSPVIGKATGHSEKLLDWGISFVRRLGWLLLGPLIYVGLLIWSLFPKHPSH